MKLNHRTRRAAKFAGVAAAAFGLSMAVQPAALAAPALSVSPSSGLSHGQSVTVSISGAAPSQTYFIGQCATVAGHNACDAATATQVTTDAAGAASVSFKVSKTYAGSTPEGTPVGTVDCAATSCTIGAGNAALDLGNVAISFR